MLLRKIENIKHILVRSLECIRSCPLASDRTHSVQMYMYIGQT